MALASSHLHRLYSTSGSGTLRLQRVHSFPGWASALVSVVILGLLITGVWVMARASRRMSRPGRIVVGLIAVYALVAAVVVFLDAYRPTGDWRGGIFEASFIVLYGLVAAGIVLGVDKGAKRLRASSLA